MIPTEQEIKDMAMEALSSYDGERFTPFQTGFETGAQWAISQMQPEWVSVTERLPNNNKHRLIQIEIPRVGIAFYIGGYDPIYKEWLNPFGDRIEEKIIQWSEIPQPPKYINQ